jgi:hypothetical protein
LKGLCLADVCIIRGWIDYAKGIGDPDANFYEGLEIIYNGFFESARERVKHLKTEWTES